MNTPNEYPNPTVQLLLITHERIGAALLRTIKNTLGSLPMHTTVISVTPNSDVEQLTQQLKNVCTDHCAKEGLLILTDLYGSTPCNLANALNAQNVKVIAGLNLPMLIRVMNYAHLSLPELVTKAVSGGKEGVINCSEKNHA